MMGECDLETIGLPSTLRVIRSVAPLVRMLPTFDLRTPCDGSGTGHGQITQAEVLKMQKCGQFPDESVKVKVAQIHCVNSQTYQK